VYAGSQDSLYYPFNFVQISPKIVHQSLIKKWICSYCDRAAIDSFLSQLDDPLRHWRKGQKQDRIIAKSFIHVVIHH
jgi:hypothetical protein